MVLSIIQTMGGELESIAHFPDQPPVQLNQLRN